MKRQLSALSPELMLLVTGALFTVGVSGCDSQERGKQEVSLLVTFVESGEPAIGAGALAIEGRYTPEEASKILSGPGVNTLTAGDEQGVITLELRPVVRACGGGLFPCTYDDEGNRGDDFTIYIVTEDSDEYLAVKLVEGEGAIGSRFRIMVIEVADPHDIERSEACERLCE